MSLAWFIFPFDPNPREDQENTVREPDSDLFIDPIVYQQQMLKRWPDVQIRTPSSSSHMLLYWTLYGNGMEGNLHNDHQTVAFYSGNGMVEFILWYRAFVPDRFALYLYHSSSGEAMELRPDVIEQDVVDFFGFNI